MMAWGYSMAELTAAQEAYPSGLLSLWRGLAWG